MASTYLKMYLDLRTQREEQVAKNWLRSTVLARFELREKSLEEAVAHFAAGLGGRRERLEGRTILLLPRVSSGTIDPLVTRTCRLPAALLGLPTGQSTDWLDCRKQFANLGMHFYEGGFAEFPPQTGLLQVRTTEKDWDLIFGAALMAAPDQRRWEQFRGWLRQQFFPAKSPASSPAQSTPAAAQGQIPTTN